MSTAVDSSNQRVAIAETILAQLGGTRFTMMTGASQFVAIDGGLQFSLPRGFAKDRINKVQIFLEPSDTYTVKALYCNHHKRTFEEVCVTENVYCDALRAVFTRMTGLDTHL